MTRTEQRGDVRMLRVQIVEFEGGLEALTRMETLALLPDLSYIKKQ
jgi:hypothetical protein